MKSILVVAHSTTSGDNRAAIKLNSLILNLKKQKYQVKAVFYHSDPQFSLPNAQSVIIHPGQTTNSKVLIHALQHAWTADYYAFINFDLKPKELELVRVIELISSKFADCAYSSGYIGKNAFPNSHIYTKITRWILSKLFTELSYLDFNSSMLVINQTCVTGLRNYIAVVDNNFLIPEIITKLHHFGAIIQAVPATSRCKSQPSLKNLIKIFFHTYRNYKWKPQHLQLRPPSVRTLLID